LSVSDDTGNLPIETVPDLVASGAESSKTRSPAQINPFSAIVVN